MDEATYQRLPDTLTIRQVRLRVAEEGFRTKTLVVVTTLRDPRGARGKDLTDLYRMRWQAELDLRSLKETMCLGVLRGKTPAMVRKEIWSHMLAYKLIRTVLAQATREHHLLPRELSFKGVVQTLLAFAPHGVGPPGRSAPPSPTDPQGAGSAPGG
jgi:IS4 transposase